MFLKFFLFRGVSFPPFYYFFFFFCRFVNIFPGLCCVFPTFYYYFIDFIIDFPLSFLPVSFIRISRSISLWPFFCCCFFLGVLRLFISLIVFSFSHHTQFFSFKCLVAFLFSRFVALFVFGRIRCWTMSFLFSTPFIRNSKLKIVF